MPGGGCPHSIMAMARSPKCQAQLERGLCACARARIDFNKIPPVAPLCFESQSLLLQLGHKICIHVKKSRGMGYSLESKPHLGHFLALAQSLSDRQSLYLGDLSGNTHTVKGV